MTVAVGFRCNQGIVLCADTLHTISGYVKQNEGKIQTIYDEDLSIAIVGAGATDYINTSIAEITRPTLEFNEIFQFEETLRDRLLGFFNRHLLPWSQYPEAERPTVELLIAVAGRKRHQYHSLFHYSGTSVYRVHEKAIGAGVLLANELISEYVTQHPALKTLEELSSLAIFILSKVKQQVDTCGGYTNLVILDEKASVAFANSAEIERLEKRYDTAEKRARRRLRSEIVDAKLKDLHWLRERTAADED